MTTPTETTSSSESEQLCQSVDAETRQYYINSLMHDVDSIKRKSFRRLILLRYIIEFEGYEAKGDAWTAWVEQKENHVSADFTNFVYALDVSLARKMKQTAIELCSEDDVDFLFSVSDDTLREYIKVLQALLV